MHTAYLFVAGFCLAILLGGCSTGAKIAAPVSTDLSIPTGTPASVGIDSTYLRLMLAQIPADGEHKLHSALVVRNGTLVSETYFNGFTRDNPHDLRSATKSLTALLIGIAIEQGVLDGVDVPMMQSLQASYPDTQDKSDITLRHLLTMSSGLDCHDQDRKTKGQEDRMYKSKDWVRYFLSLSTVYPPGDTTRYCTGGVVALGEVLAQATGKDMADFADQVLFDPLEIDNYAWARFDGDRKVDTGGHLLLTPQGMAKIGMLVSQGGRWNGQQVVPEEWIRLSTQPHTQVGGNPYGFLWWINQVNYGGKEVEVVTARGNGGQVIFIVPAFDLVTVFTAGYYNSEKAEIPYRLFYNFVLTAVDEMKPFLSQ